MTTATQTPTIGIIGEGPADYTIIQMILAGYFGDPDIDPNPLQPLRDASGTFEAGGWHQVLEYCGSEKFRSAFMSNDYIIVQIDTDISERHPTYQVPHRDASGQVYNCQRRFYN